MGHSLNGTRIARKQAGIDTSAEADGMRAAQIGLPISANPYRRAHAQARIEAWERGWRLHQVQAAPPPPKRYAYQ
jgi:hypothetical protein